MLAGDRKTVRIVALAALIAGALLGPVGPAAAKGPSSATITGPGIDQPIEMVANPVGGTMPQALVRLMEQSGVWYGSGVHLPTRIESPAGRLGPAYTLAWVNMGPPERSVEQRTIRQYIYLEADGGPLIHTPGQESLQGWGGDVTGWYAAPEGLRETLVELGVPAPARSGSGAAALLAARVVWYLGGLAVVLAAALIWSPGLRRRARAPLSSAD
jgi:hypothetical protein